MAASRCACPPAAPHGPGRTPPARRAPERTEPAAPPCGCRSRRCCPTRWPCSAPCARSAAACPRPTGASWTRRRPRTASPRSAGARATGCRSSGPPPSAGCGCAWCTTWGPRCPSWHPLVRELHTALAQSGLFRTVELHPVAPDGTVPARAAEVTATGRTVTLVISDCMGPQWREGPAGRRWFATLRRWADRLPLAVLQPLPERLWPTTALPATPGLIGAPHAAAPSAALAFAPYDASGAPPGAVPVPVLEVAPAWLSHWAKLVASGVQVPGAACWLGPAPDRPDDAEPREDLTLLSAEELVLRFRSSASPEAFRLAGHLAVGEPQLPLMRLVHAAVERRPRPQHLAEVVLSGMLTGAPGGAPGAYAFREGVRDVLLGTLPRSARGRTRQLLSRVGGLIDERAGAAPGVLRALAPGAGRGPGRGEPVEAEPFAEVSEESVRRLGGGGSMLFAGRYRLLRQTSSGDEWLSEDTANGDLTVLVRVYSHRTWARVNVTENARLLAQIKHSGVAAVLDYGIHGGTPYVVQEFVPGSSLGELLADEPDGLPTERLVTTLPRVAGALAALHHKGIAHGALDLDHIVVAPGGPVLRVLGTTPLGGARRTDDLRALGELTQVLAPPREERPEWLRDGLRAAVDDLVSRDPEAQARGLRRLRRLVPPQERRHYALLGPVRVSLTRAELATCPRHELAMLCLLLLRQGGVVPYHELIDGVWDAPAPATARRLLDAYAAHLNEVLGPDAVRQRDNGYDLPLDPVHGVEDIDVFRFQDLAAEARRARAAGDTARASANSPRRRCPCGAARPWRPFPGPPPARSGSA
ncbi:SAV_2336 N-terminal domain-related protein [Streptomyces sp. PmtG]